MTRSIPQWQSLVRMALIGTTGAPATPTNLAAAQGPLATVLSRVDWSQREQGLLDTAVAVALWQRAGQRLDLDFTALPVCEPDSLPRASSKTSDHLRRMLASAEYKAALPEWLQAMANANKRAAEDVLPLLLDRGRQQASAREWVLRIIGRRGAWLAAQNPDWRYAAEVDANTAWQTGAPDERKWVLERLRAVDPDGALQLLVSTWDSENAHDRTDFASVLAIGLSMDDEPFLEAALDDRSKDVRRTAAELLSRLAQSRLVLRMIERTKPLLTFAARSPTGAGKIKVAYPAEFTKDMQRDGIEQKPPAIVKTIGEKAWQLTQLIGLVPPATWSAAWGRAPDDLVRAAGKSDEQMVLLEGWTLAAQRFADATWAEAVLRVWPTADDVMEGLLDTLPVERREAHVLGLLKSNRNSLQGDHPALAALTLCHHTWSAALSRNVLDRVRQSIAASTSEYPDWHLRNALEHFALHIAPEVAAEATAGWPVESEKWAQWAKPVGEFISLLAFRREMLEAIFEHEEAE